MVSDTVLLWLQSWNALDIIAMVTELDSIRYFVAMATELECIRHHCYGYRAVWYQILCCYGYRAGMHYTSSLWLLSWVVLALDGNH